jgi:hypothetical protein
MNAIRTLTARMTCRVDSMDSVLILAHMFVRFIRERNVRRNDIGPPVGVQTWGNPGNAVFLLKVIISVTNVCTEITVFEIAPRLNTN